MSGRAGKSGRERGESLMIVTDLDGTLLDDRTYSFEPALPALAQLAESGGTLTLASSKTRAEMEELAALLGIRGPLIAENGALLLLPQAEGGYEVHADGVAREFLVRSLEELAQETGIALRGFSSLEVETLSRLTGLALPAARLAMKRDYDEPFLLTNTALADRLARAARRRGLAITRGGRFFHLTGMSDKGTALRRLLELSGQADRGWQTVGLGDARNDLPFLRRVDRPIVVPGSDGSVRREMRLGLPDAERAPAPGPRGWNDAVLAVLAGERLPTVADYELP